jgi:hypothetical protein
MVGCWESDLSASTVLPTHLAVIADIRPWVQVHDLTQPRRPRLSEQETLKHVSELLAASTILVHAESAETLRVSVSIQTVGHQVVALVVVELIQAVLLADHPAVRVPEGASTWSKKALVVTDEPGLRGEVLEEIRFWLTEFLASVQVAKDYAESASEGPLPKAP